MGCSIKKIDRVIPVLLVDSVVVVVEVYCFEILGIAFGILLTYHSKTVDNYTLQAAGGGGAGKGIILK